LADDDTGLSRTAQSVLNRNEAGEDTSAMFLGLIREAQGGKRTRAPKPHLPVFPVPSRREKRAASHERLRHRIIVTVLILVPMAAFYAIQALIWPRNPLPHGLRAEIYSWMGAIWAVAAIPAVLEAIGLYLWKPPLTPPGAIGNLVCWRIVSRGINREALSASIEACRREMRLCPLFPYVIEVVVDSNEHAEGLPPAARDLHYIVVPKDYQTPGGTKAKARALNYALHASTIGPKAWIVHMDEESWPTRSGITGIAAMIREEERDRPDAPRVGQGTITYHRNWEKHPYFTLSDCIRSGSDKGRLYLSMLIGVPLFGLHGSFIVVRNDVEQDQGFDVGPVGSLTEDAWWGVLASADGVRCRWVDGFVAEQCTHQVKDFIKQRRRWFTGARRTAMKAPAALRWRAVLIMSTLAWASAPFAWAYTISHLIDGGYISPWIRALANFSLAVYIATTLIGLQLNMRDHGIRRFSQKVRWALTWMLCLVFFSAMESLAVAYAIIWPEKGWHVVRK
jgi:beta-1,4-mannosyltransferase